MCYTVLQILSSTGREFYLNLIYIHYQLLDISSDATQDRDPGCKTLSFLRFLDILFLNRILERGKESDESISSLCALPMRMYLLCHNCLYTFV